MKLYNTLLREKQEFKPIKDKQVGMYVCGPTVYDFAHIGNLRTYIFEDILRRTLIYNGFKVKEVMNITDVDDKTIKASKGDKKKLTELATHYEKKFFEDLEKLNIFKPEIITKATKFIAKMVDFIQILLDKGYAYKAKDGCIYFKIDKFEKYGCLAKLDKTNLKIGARIKHDNYEKENLSDFVLWKAYDKNDGEIFWETKLGKGRPGWHIECSTMAQDILGDTLDIHCGGVDLIFPHHENEITQSESKTGKKFANYFVHGEHLLVDGKKMAKSSHNFFILEDIIRKNYNPLSFRYLCLEAHYRSKLNFTWKSLDAGQNSLNNLYDKIRELGNCKGKILNNYKKEFLNAINDDLDMPKALTVVWKLVKSNENNGDKKLTLENFDRVLGLSLRVKETEIPDKVKKLVEEREEARKNKNWEKADELRKRIEKIGYEIKDSMKGADIKKFRR